MNQPRVNRTRIDGVLVPRTVQAQIDDKYPWTAEAPPDIRALTSKLRVVYGQFLLATLQDDGGRARVAAEVRATMAERRQAEAESIRDRLMTQVEELERVLLEARMVVMRTHQTMPLLLRIVGQVSAALGCAPTAGPELTNHHLSVSWGTVNLVATRNGDAVDPTHARVECTLTNGTGANLQLPAAYGTGFHRDHLPLIIAMMPTAPSTG